MIRNVGGASDLELIGVCLRGDQEAWATLVRRYAGLVYSVPLRYGLDEDDAADVFQNTCSTLWEHLPELRDRARVGSWLVTVAGRLAYQQYRLRQRQSTRHEAGFDLDSQPDTSAQPEEVVVAEAEAARLREAMLCLPERCRTLLHYLFYDADAPTYVEIGRRLSVSPDTVGPLRSRCLRHLRALLAEYHER